MRHIPASALFRRSPRRRRWYSLTLLFGLCHAPSLHAQRAPHFDGRSWWEHVKVIADDKMEGRLTGTPGLERAQRYVVDQLRRAGLEPAGSDGFYQPVGFVQRVIDERASSAVLVTGGQTTPLAPGDEIIFGTKVEPTSEEIVAPMVFVGNGLRIPETKLDDFAGLDLRGKVVVLIAGSPADVSPALAGHYSSIAERWSTLRAAGATGMITIPNPASMDIPWGRIAANRLQPSMDLDDPEFNETAGLRLAMTFNPAYAEKLFAGSGHTFRELARLAKDRKPLPHFPMAISVRTRTVIHESKIQSANLVARLRGSDTQLGTECVVLSAHLDHLGIGAAVDGDRLYNGAMDNGSGSALLIDLAAELKAHPVALRRSLLFVFVTAEEKGLLGSKYFAAHPTVPARAMVANINTDMFLPIIPLQTMVVQGLDESDLGAAAAGVVKRFGVDPIPDPEPLRNLFVRSDQYSFIRHGIPAVKLNIGAPPGSPEENVLKDWRTKRYHAPSDDLNQPVNLETAAKYEEIMRALVIEIANAPARPQWRATSFFRRYADSAR